MAATSGTLAKMQFHLKSKKSKLVSDLKVLQKQRCMLLQAIAREQIRYDEGLRKRRQLRRLLYHEYGHEHGDLTQEEVERELSFIEDHQKANEHGDLTQEKVSSGLFKKLFADR